MKNSKKILKDILINNAEKHEIKDKGEKYFSKSNKLIFFYHNTSSTFNSKKMERFPIKNKIF